MEKTAGDRFQLVSHGMHARKQVKYSYPRIDTWWQGEPRGQPRKQIAPFPCGDRQGVAAIRKHEAESFLLAEECPNCYLRIAFFHFWRAKKSENEKIVFFSLTPFLPKDFERKRGRPGDKSVLFYGGEEKRKRKLIGEKIVGFTETISCDDWPRFTERGRSASETPLNNKLISHLGGNFHFRFKSLSQILFRIRFTVSLFFQSGRFYQSSVEETFDSGGRNKTNLKWWAEEWLSSQVHVQKQDPVVSLVAKRKNVFASCEVVFFRRRTKGKNKFLVLLAL